MSPLTPAELATGCVNALLQGTNITFSMPRKEKWPPGFPRGELLSVNAEVENRSFDPLKILAHIQQHAKRGNL